MAFQISPVGEMVLVKHDKDQTKTKGGLILPDISPVTVMTGMIAAMPERMKDDNLEYPFSEFDRIIYDIRYRIPVELLPENRFFLVDAKWIYGVVQDVDNSPYEE